MSENEGNRAAKQSIYEREAECKTLHRKLVAFSNRLDAQLRTFHESGRPFTNESGAQCAKRPSK